MGVLLAMVAAAGFGASGIFARLGFTSAKSLNPAGGTFVSIIASLLFVAPITLFFEREALASVSPSAVLWFALIGAITFPFARYSYFKGVDLIGASRASALAAAAPLFAMLAAVAFLHERVTPFILTGILLIMGGLYSLSRSSDKAGDPRAAGGATAKRAHVWGYVFSLFSALGWGGGAAMTKWGVTNLAPPLVGVLVATIVGVVALSWPGVSNLRSSPASKRSGMGFFLLAGLMSTIGATANYAALGMAPVVIVSPLANTSPLFTLLFLFTFLRGWERITWRTILGMAVVIGGSAFIALGRSG